MGFDPIVSGPYWDAHGNPYELTQSGQKSYMTPDYAMQSHDPKVQAWAAQHGASITRDPSGNITNVQFPQMPNSFWGPQVWNPDTAQWETKFDLNSAGGQLLLGGGFFGGDAVGSALKLGVPAVSQASNAGPAASLAGSDASLIPAGGVASGLPGAMDALPSAGATGAFGPISAGPLASGETGMSATQAALGGTPPASLAASDALSNASPLLRALAGIGGLAGGAIAGKVGANTAVPQSLTDMLNVMSGRVSSQQPLFNAVNSGIYQMLPNYAKPGSAG